MRAATKKLKGYEIGRLNLDVLELGRALGGRTHLFNMISDEYAGLSKPTFNKWFDRRKIPLNWLMAILELAEANGYEIDIFSFAVPPGYASLADTPDEERERYLNRFGRTIGVVL